MKKKIKLFCFGFGQVAKYFVKNIIKNNYDLELVTTNTTDTKLIENENLKYKSYYFLDDNFDNNLIKDLNSSNEILISIPPKNKEDIVLKKFGKSFKENKFKWITYLSATNVYGDKKGEWVDEKSNLSPTSEKGIARMNAESAWMKYFKNYNLPIQIFRLSGIYSIENNILKRLKEGKLNLVEKKNHFFSRIHVEDIAEILTLSLKKFEPGQIFNISDNYPCSNNEIAEYASLLMKISLPKKINLNEINNQMLKSFYKDSKKVNSNKMKKFFNYNLKYPTFKEGLQMIRSHIF